MSPAYRSFAKINLHLQVVGKRGDGYHELRTVFQTVELHDVLRFEPGGEGVRLEVSGADLPTGPENLVHRAASEFLSRWGGLGGLSIELRKNVPAGGGLGGGSSNAATTLLALRDFTGLPADPRELWPLARELGADVPYFLVGGTALGVGRGDEIVPISDLPEEEVWIAVPDIAVPTGEVFGLLPDGPPAPLAGDVLALAQGGDPRSVWNLHLWNDLQDVVFRSFSGVAEVYDSLIRGGFGGVRLSGSGACLVARWTGDAEPCPQLPANARLLRSRFLNRSSIHSQRLIA